LYSKGVEFVISEFVLNELYNLKNKAKKKGISDKEFNKLFEFLLSISIVANEKLYKPFLNEAVKISPHKKDAPLFALSLAFNKAPIWSREPRLKRQKLIKVVNDKEVEEKFLK
jgi:predicted nucleic acid-binding protein